MGNNDDGRRTSAEVVLRRDDGVVGARLVGALLGAGVHLAVLLGHGWSASVGRKR